jgi:hypothetical protein
MKTILPIFHQKVACVWTNSEAIPFNAPGPHANEELSKDLSEATSIIIGPDTSNTKSKNCHQS